MEASRGVPGWVADSCGPELTIKLRTGPTFTIPRREDLRWGDSVLVCFDHERLRPGQVISLAEAHAVRDVAEMPWIDADLPHDIPGPEELLLEEW
jgi:hypothetical protein